MVLIMKVILMILMANSNNINDNSINIIIINV